MEIYFLSKLSYSESYNTNEKTKVIRYTNKYHTYDKNKYTPRQQTDKTIVI